MKRGKGSRTTPRLNSKRFERLVIDEIRGNILADDNVRDRVKLVDEEMEGVTHEHRKKLESIAPASESTGSGSPGSRSRQRRRRLSLSERRVRLDTLWFRVRARSAH